MSGLSGAHQDVDIDLSALFRAIWRRRTRVLLATVACAGLAFAGASLIKPDFRSEARLLIESRAPTLGAGASAAQNTAQAFDESAITSQVQVLRSVDLIKQVARNMKLYDIAEFDPTANPSAISDLLVMFGVKKNPLDLAPEERVLKEFQEKLQVYQVEKSRVIGIVFTSKDPALAAAIPNEMAKVYLSLQSGAKLDTNSEATRWLEPEIANLREKVREAEAKVAAYRSSADLLPTGQTSTFAEQQLNDISLELARVRGERASAEAKAEGVRNALSNGRPVDTLSDVVGSQMIQRLKETESTIQGQIADLSTTLLDGHPRLKGLKSQLEGIRAQIRAETQKILGSLENEASVSELREQQLVRQLNTLKATSARAGEDQVELRALEREAAAQRQLLETYLARYREATSLTGENATPADARVISGAVEPTEASFPKVGPITLVAALAAFLVSSAVIMLMELFSGRALRPVGLAATAPAVPRTRAARQGSLLSVEASAPDAAPELNEALPVDDEFSIDAVSRHIVEKEVRVAICVSPGGDEGSSGTVVLARLIAGAGLKVILVDLTGSACPSRLMLSSAALPGITDLLTGDVAFGDIIHPDRLSGAHVIPQGGADPGQAMRAIDRLQMIVGALADAYDTVLVECGPAGAEAVRRITRSTEASIVLSAPDVADSDLVEIVTEFGEAGFSDLMLMTGPMVPEPSPDRRAA
ncbi:GumC family protein [Ensifer soli]|uniref:GumC family protein n=1 Tax=Ciceribacter sp. sgz301302 TaxID=3342379 RepID=UPI0035BB4614